MNIREEIRFFVEEASTSARGDDFRVDEFTDKIFSLFTKHIGDIEKELKSTENMSQVCSEYSDDLDTSIHFDDGYSQGIMDFLEALKRLK